MNCIFGPLEEYNDRSSRAAGPSERELYSTKGSKCSTLTTVYQFLPFSKIILKGGGAIDKPFYQLASGSGDPYR